VSQKYGVEISSRKGGKTPEGGLQGKAYTLIKIGQLTQEYQRGGENLQKPALRGRGRGLRKRSFYHLLKDRRGLYEEEKGL